MDRVPCKVCGVEVLPMTADSYGGLCGQCAKGRRPCVFCGKRVFEPLTDGVYAHWECSTKKHGLKESLGWESADDIDWSVVQKKMHEKLSALFADPPNPCPKCELVFWIDTNGGLNFDVYQVSPDGTQVRFGNLVKGWIDDMCAFDEAFDAIIEGLAEDDSDRSLEIDARLRDIVRVKCQELELKNFGYQNNAQVTWRIKDDA